MSELDEKIKEALEAVIPCLEDWIRSTGFGEVNRRDKAALALVKQVLAEKEAAK